MIAALAHFDLNAQPNLIDPGLPYFLDGFDANPDDLHDWWLDLGAVDFSGPAGR